MKESIEARLKRLKGKTESLKKGDETNKPKKNGGKRPGSGRKPKEVNMIARGIKAYLDKHFNESVKVQVVDPLTQKTRTIKKPRIIVVLEVLYNIGVRDKNPDALNKWLDRALGRPAQPIQGGDEDKPILLKIDF